MSLKQHLITLAYLTSITVCYPLFSEVHEFNTVISHKNGGKNEYFLQTMKGTERMNPGLNRLSMLSEDQADYTTPESACGPTALLNILIWYEKFGLIPPLYRDANPRHYKQKLFREIDRRLNQQSGFIRTEEIGIQSLDTAVVMDSIVNERTNGKIRIHTDLIDAPLKLTDCLETTKNFRAGYLVVRPKDAATGELLGAHATVIIRTDRAGYITLATWGQRYHGLLRKRADGQWFIPQDRSQMELKIVGLTRFIPYKPAEEF